MLYGPLDGEMADYTYDCRNRLTKVTTAETTTEYRYDAEDVRTEEYITDEKSGNTYRKVYVTDRETTYSQLLTETIQEKNSLGIYETTETKTYTYGIGLLSEQSDSTKQTLYYHFDNLGSTTEVTNASGTVVYRFAYDTYGKLTGIYQGNTNMMTTTGQQKTVSEVLRETGIRFLYNGEFGVQTDTNSLYYMRARYYNPVIRRFINRDIVAGTPAESQSLNRYAYAQGNPVNQLDPFGLSPQNPYSKAHSFLDFLGLFWSGADVANALLYMAEGDMKNAALSLMCALPLVGIAVAVGVKGVIKAGKLLSKTASFVKKFAKAQNIAEATVKFGKKASKTKQAVANIVKKATKKASKVAGEAAEVAKSSAKTTVNVAEEVGKGASKSGTRRGSLELDLQFFAKNPENIQSGVNTSKKSVLKKNKLPTTGKIRYVPSKDWNAAQPLNRINGGFVDRFDNIWTKGPSRTTGEAFEWDVQLSKLGRERLGWLSRDGSHLNVSLRGKITHQ